VPDQRGQLLFGGDSARTAALGSAVLARLLGRHRTYRVEMAYQSYDLQLTRYDERGWRATFYTTGMEHSPTSATRSAWERAPWHATQRAAWEAIGQASDG
jgi:hypothetical protein